MVWGILLEACFDELGKRNPEHLGKEKMVVLKDKLRLAREVTTELRLRKSGHESEASRLVDRIDTLQKSLELVTYNVNDMMRNLESYVKGFLHYLQLLGDKTKTELCLKVYEGFKHEKFAPKVPPVLN
jgi:hypothetical protein